MARTLFGSSSETSVISSRNPCCFLRIGITLSLTVRATSLAFPVLLVISTTRVNISVVLLSLRVESCTVTAAVGVQTAHHHTPPPVHIQCGKRRAADRQSTICLYSAS